MTGRVQAGEHSGLLVLGSGHNGDGDRNEHEAESETGDEHAGEQVGEVAAVGVDAGEQQHPAAVTAKPTAIGRRTPACGIRWVATCTPAPSRGEWQERQTGDQRAGSAHVLQVQRGQQEVAEQHGRGGEHDQKSPAHAAVGEAVDAKQGLGAQLERRRMR